MTEQRIRELISAGESLAVEFKGEDRAPLSDRDLVEAAVCLTNRDADDLGWLLIGVEDDGRITGARPRHEAGRTDPLRVQALIANRTRPTLTCRTALVSIDGREVVAIEVPRARAPTSTSDGTYLRRALGGDGRPACLPYYYHEMLGRGAELGALDYSMQVVEGARWDDLDPLEFDRFRRAIREARGQADVSLLELSDVELAKALGAVAANHEVTSIRALALLLFGREGALRRFLPTHEAAFQVLSGTRVEVNEFFRWPILRTMEDLLARFRARNREAELAVGLFRVTVPDYSERAVREAIANALIHRDYTRVGTAHFQWHGDRIEISNPGGFPEGVRLDNLLVTPPRPRNPLLADAFKRAGIVERTARGIDTIFQEQLQNGRPAPSYERSTEASVVLVLPGGVANLEFVRLVTEEQQAGLFLGIDELLVLNQLWLERRTTITEAARLIQKSEGDARATLERLVEAGLAQARGERRGRAYHLSAATFRRLGAPAAYIRARGFEPIQQEQMVLQFVDSHGAISRAQAAELCQVQPHQAYRVLSRLVERGRLRRVGRRGRNVRYEKPS